MEVVLLKITESQRPFPRRTSRGPQVLQQRLGLPPPGRAGWRRCLQDGTTGFLVFPSTGSHQATHTQLSLDVGNVEATVEELKKSA